MKFVTLSIIILSLVSCAHTDKSKDKEIEKVQNEFRIYKQETVNVCWKAIKESCKKEFNCLDRGSKYCQSISNGKK